MISVGLVGLFKAANAREVFASVEVDTAAVDVCGPRLVCVSVGLVTLFKVVDAREEYALVELAEARFGFVSGELGAVFKVEAREAYAAIELVIGVVEM